MDRCPKDEPTAENLVCKKALPIPEKIGNTCWEGGGGGLNIISTLSDLDIGPTSAIHNIASVTLQSYVTNHMGMLSQAI